MPQRLGAGAAAAALAAGRTTIAGASPATARPADDDARGRSATTTTLEGQRIAGSVRDVARTDGSSSAASSSTTLDHSQSSSRPHVLCSDPVPESAGQKGREAHTSAPRSSSSGKKKAAPTSADSPASTANNYNPTSSIVTVTPAPPSQKMLSSLSRRPAASPTSKPLPPPTAFSFTSILSSLEDSAGTRTDIDAIAALCGRSRLSLASAHASHREPVGAGALGDGALEMMAEEDTDQEGGSSSERGSVRDGPAANAHAAPETAWHRLGKWRGDRAGAPASPVTGVDMHGCDGAERQTDARGQEGVAMSRLLRVSGGG